MIFSGVVNSGFAGKSRSHYVLAFVFCLAFYFVGTNAYAQTERDGVSVEAGRFGEPGGNLSVSSKVTLGGAQSVNEKIVSASQWSSLNLEFDHAPTNLGLVGYFGYTRAVVESESSGDFDHPAVAVSKAWEPDQWWLKRVAGGFSAVLPGNRSAWDVYFRHAYGAHVELVAEAGRLSLSEVMSVSQGVYGLSSEDAASFGVPSNVLKSATTLDYLVSHKLTAELVYQFFGTSGGASGSVSGGSDSKTSQVWNLLALYKISEGFMVDAGVGNGVLSSVPNGHFDQLAGSAAPAQVVFLDMVMSL